MRIGTADHRNDPKQKKDKEIINGFFKRDFSTVEGATKSTSSDRAYDHVTIGPRLLAGVLDCFLLVLMPTLLFSWAIQENAVQGFLEILYSPLCAVLLIFYVLIKTILEGSTRQASIGMTICGLKVGLSHANGFVDKEIGMTRALVRNLNLAILLLLLLPLSAKLAIEGYSEFLLILLFGGGFLSFRAIRKLPQDLMTDTVVFRVTEYK